MSVGWSTLTEANPNNFQVLFDDHFAEASPREFGVYKAPSTSHVLDYESDSDLEEEEIEDEAKHTTKGKTASPARSTHGEGEAQDSHEKRPSSPTGIVALSDAFGEPQKLKRGEQVERRKGRVVHVDGFAYHTCVAPSCKVVNVY